MLEIRDRLIKAFAEDGIIVPASAALLWTGSEADRLARCATPADEWILGFGVFTNPWDYPPMDESFKKVPAFIPGRGWNNHIASANRSRAGCQSYGYPPPVAASTLGSLSVRNQKSSTSGMDVNEIRVGAESSTE